MIKTIATTGTLMSFRAGETISEGNAAAYIWHGVVGAEGGTQDIFRVYQEKEVAGVLNLIPALGLMKVQPDCRLIALKDTVVSVLDHQEYVNVLCDMDAQTREQEFGDWIRVLVQEMLGLNRLWKVSRTEEIPTRVYVALRDLAHGDEVQYDIKLLARMTGTTSELAARAIRKLISQGLVERLTKVDLRLLASKSDTCEAQAIRRYINN